MLSACADLVRRHDPERYFTALFAPADKRELLFTLYAFNHELARAREVTREPGIALIRLQWWREVVEGAMRAHEVAGPLRAALKAGLLPQESLLAMIDARALEADPCFTTLADWQAWLMLGAGSLMAAAGFTLSAPAAQVEKLRRLGAGCGAAGTIRNQAAHARQGRCLMPDDSAAARALARSLLGAAQPWHADIIAAALPAVTARGGGRLAVVWAAIRSLA